MKIDQIHWLSNYSCFLFFNLKFSQNYFLKHCWPPNAYNTYIYINKPIKSMSAYYHWVMGCFVLVIFFLSLKHWINSGGTPECEPSPRLAGGITKNYSKHKMIRE